MTAVSVRRNPYAPLWRQIPCAALMHHTWETVSRKRIDGTWESWRWCSRCWARQG